MNPWASCSESANLAGVDPAAHLADATRRALDNSYSVDMT